MTLSFIFGFFIGMLIAVIISPILAYEFYKKSQEWKKGGIVPCKLKGKSTALKKTTGSIIHGYPKPGDTVYYLVDITHTVMKTTLRKITLEMDSQGINVNVFLDKDKNITERIYKLYPSMTDDMIYELEYKGSMVEHSPKYKPSGFPHDYILITWWESSSTNIFANREDAELTRKELLIAEMDKISLDYLKRIKEPVKELL